MGDNVRGEERMKTALVVRTVTPDNRGIGAALFIQDALSQRIKEASMGLFQPFGFI